MNVLELFSGSGVVSETFRRHGHKTVTMDKFFDSDYKIDIMDIDKKLLRRILKENYMDRISFVWASPPCQSYSIASGFKHWSQWGRYHTPRSSFAALSDAMVIKSIELIEILDPDFFVIENPVGILRKRPFMLKFRRVTATYCQYGDHCMKPTDLFTNIPDWIPKRCKNGDTCHESSPRGSHNGTEGKKDAHERAKIPKQLISEIIKTIGWEG